MGKTERPKGDLTLFWLQEIYDDLADARWTLRKQGYNRLADLTKIIEDMVCDEMSGEEKIFLGETNGGRTNEK